VSISTGTSLVLADAAAGLEAVHLRQHHVQDHGVDAAFGQPGQSLAGPRGGVQFQVEPAQIGGQRRGQVLVVVDQEDAVHGGIQSQRRTLPA
jgi:hypothetical protein